MGLLVRLGIPKLLTLPRQLCWPTDGVGTRSRVSHFMNKFRKLGLIDYNGHIEVHSSLLSAVLHEKPQLKED